MKSVLWLEGSRREQNHWRKKLRELGIETTFSSSFDKVLRALRKKGDFALVIIPEKYFESFSGRELKLQIPLIWLGDARSGGFSQRVRGIEGVQIYCPRERVLEILRSLFPREGLKRAALPEGAELIGKIEELERQIAEERSRLEEKVNERTEQLERAKREWEQTFDAIQEPVMILEGDYSIVRANLALANSLGKDIRRLIGKQCYRVLMSRESPCPGCPLPEALAEEQTLRREIWNGKGTTLYQVSSFPLQSSGRKRVVNEYRDITEEKKLQEEIYKADKLSSLGMLAGRVAHEINNPLAGILGYTQLLLLETSRDSPLYQPLKKIEEAALRCKKIVQDLLQFSHLQPEGKPQKYDINHLIRESVELYHLIPPKNGPILELNLKPRLPLLKVDPDKIYGAVFNLISNAKSATPPGGKIAVSTFVEDGKVIISVRDTGSGIPENLREKIFEPFFTTKKRGEGTGIGLYTVRKTAQEYGGDLVLHWSELGKGSEFRIYLPIEGRG